MKRTLTGLLAICFCHSAAVPQEIPGPVQLDGAHAGSGGVAAAPLYTIPVSYWLALQDAAPFPKPIYSWPVDLEVLRVDANFEPLKQFTRLTGSIGIGSVDQGWTDDDYLRANDIAIAAGAGVTINFSPYHAIDGCHDDPADWSDTGSEQAKFAINLQHLRALDIRVNALALDSECYRSKDRLVTGRLDAIYGIAKSFYPSQAIYWYRNGDWLPNLNVESGGIRSIVQYRTYSPDYTERWLDLWQLRNQMDCKDWAIWTTLGSGYGWETPTQWKWKLNLPVEHYRMLARMHLADARVKAILLYPNPFRPLSMPESADAFVAYLSGAASRK